MNNSLLSVLSKWYERLPWVKPEQGSLDTLTAFVRDAEHDVMSVVMALQAHIDLLHEEQEHNHLPVIRFAVLNRAIARIVADMTVLSAITELVRAPRSKDKQNLDGLMQEITRETQSAFDTSQVLLTCDIATGTMLIGTAAALKVMITGMVLAVLHKSHEFETIRIVGLTHKKLVSLSVDTGSGADEGIFTPWQLGELRLTPTNGDGISMAAVDAMARLHQGHLSVSTLPDLRHGYRLSFAV